MSEKIDKVLAKLAANRDRITFDEEAHKYYFDGEERISVTTHLQQVTVKDSFAMVDPKVMEKARRKGTLVHNWSECDDLIELGEFQLPMYASPEEEAEYMPILDQWTQYKKDHNPRFIAVEQRLCPNGWAIAGTIDRIAISEDEKTLYIIDIKTGSTTTTENILQQQYYAHMLKKVTSWRGSIECHLVHIKKNKAGIYKYKLKKV